MRLGPFLELTPVSTLAVLTFPPTPRCVDHRSIICPTAYILKKCIKTMDYMLVFIQLCAIMTTYRYPTIKFSLLTLSVVMKVANFMLVGTYKAVLTMKSPQRVDTLTSVSREILCCRQLPARGPRLRNSNLCTCPVYVLPQNCTIGLVSIA